jgi:hypothetical protein
MGEGGGKIVISSDKLRTASKAVGAAAEVFENARRKFEDRLATTANPRPWTTEGVGAQWDENYGDSERVVKETLRKAGTGLRDLANELDRMSTSYEHAEEENAR